MCYCNFFLPYCIYSISLVYVKLLIINISVSFTQIAKENTLAFLQFFILKGVFLKKAYRTKKQDKTYCKKQRKNIRQPQDIFIASVWSFTYRIKFTVPIVEYFSFLVGAPFHKYPLRNVASIRHIYESAFKGTP